MPGPRTQRGEPRIDVAAQGRYVRGADRSREGVPADRGLGARGTRNRAPAVDARGDGGARGTKESSGGAEAVLRLFGWVGASVGLHAVFFVAVVAGLIPVSGISATVESHPIDFEILAVPAEPELRLEPERRDPEPAPAPRPEEEVRAAHLPEPLPRERPEPPSREPREPSEATDGPPAPQASSSIDVPEVTPQPRAESDEERQRRLAAMTNPLAAARSGFDFGPGPSQRGAPAGLGAPDRGPSERDIEASLGSGLRAEAMTKRHLTREPFRLQRRADGSHVWNGPRLMGIINPDGTVRFQDRPGFNPDLATGSATFDITEAIMGASGQDPLRAEREYFMRETEELRAQLEAQHRRQETSSGLARIPGRLTRVWQTENRTPGSRRWRIFQLWDECDEDDASGREARAAMIRWIRLNLPAGGEHAYTEDEIRRFNARRESREEFAPY